VSRLVAYFGNEPDRVECALFPARSALYAGTPEKASGWGLGFVQGGDVLLQKRPRAEATEVDPEVLERLRVLGYLGGGEKR